MIKFIFTLMLFLAYTNTFSQNVGIGTLTPNAKLEVKSSSNPVTIFNGPNNMWLSLYENDVYRGYLGSYAGNASDVDFGTGGGNTSGSVHLTNQGIPHFTMDSAGKIGIGTTLPHYGLHVNNGDLFVQSSSGRIMYGYDGGNQWRMNSTNGGADLLWSSYNGATETFRHYFSQNGNVGIGTGSSVPVARLDVISSSNSSATTNFMLRNSTGDTLLRMRDNGYMSIGYNGTVYGRPFTIQGTGMNYYNDPTTFGGAIFPDINHNLILWSDNTGSGQNIVLQPSWGQVTVGTYTPATGYKISIKGKLICEEARVQLSANWPDYVFNKNYKLMPLADLEKSIKKEQHLPDIPAAADMESNGIMLGDMNRRIMEKVEELTLYIIDLNKKNEKLQQEVNMLKTQMHTKNK